MNKKTFTLIEMLIVIVIIGILAAALIPRLQSVQGRARDSKRKVDIRAIATANEVYFTDNGVYARANTCAYNDNASCAIYSTGTSPWIVTLSGVMTSVPVDPINNSLNPWVTGNYSYLYYSVYNTPRHTYDLVAQLENRNDSDRCAIKQYRYNNDTSARCGAYSPQVYDYSPNVPNQ